MLPTRHAPWPLGSARRNSSDRSISWFNSTQLNSSFGPATRLLTCRRQGKMISYRESPAQRSVNAHGVVKSPESRFVQVPVRQRRPHRCPLRIRTGAGRPGTGSDKNRREAERSSIGFPAVPTALERMTPRGRTTRPSAHSRRRRRAWAPCWTKQEHRDAKSQPSVAAEGGRR